MEITDDKAIQVFKYLDKENMNQIDKNDITQAMRYLGIIKTKNAFATLINGLPDMIDLNQFLDLIHNENEHLIDTNDLVKAFEVFDENGTGKICAKELYHALSVIGEKLTKNDINDLNNMAKPDKDGMIHYDDLVNCLLEK